MSANADLAAVQVHLYERSPHSNAGNCWCGRAERHVLHPHEPMATWKAADRCTCSLPVADHPLPTWIKPTPVNVQAGREFAAAWRRLSRPSQ